MVTTAGLWLLVGAIVSSCPSVASQYVPSTWRKPTITIPRSETIQRARSAIDRHLSTLPVPINSNLGDWLTLSQLCIEMADFDILTGQDKYQQALKAYVPAAERVQPEFVYEYTRGGIAFGIAAARAYEAYKDDLFLDYAVRAWNWGRRNTISDKDIDAGTIPVKSFTLQQTCGTASIVGGTFGFNATDDTELASLATGTFLVLSLSLYKITSNETYLGAANTSASFLRRHLYINRGLVAFTISGKQEDQCRLDQSTPAYSSGILMQGISLLRDVTSSTQDDGLINDLVVGGSSNDQWYNSDGIITTMDFSGLYISRGLLQVYNTTPDTILRNYISAYLSTQYNAAIDFAAGSGDIYALSWSGPAANSFDGDGQTTAISVLLAGIVLANETVTVTSSGSPSAPTVTASAPPASSSKTPVASIVGGIIGGLAFLAGISAFAFALRRRRRRLQQEEERSTLGPQVTESNLLPVRINTVPTVSVTDSSAFSDTMTPSETAENEYTARQGIYRRPTDTRREPSRHWGPPPDYSSEWAS